MRKPIIAGNWKMNMLLSEAEKFVDELVGKSDLFPDVEIIIAPPFTALSRVKGRLKQTPIQLAAQNMHHEPRGAYTGEISGPMLKDAGCQYVILGHSERRKYFHEDDVLINKKIKAALDHGLRIIFCIGETREQRDQGLTWKVLESQLRKGLKGIDPECFSTLVVAYEPVWAIGTGVNATPEEAEEAHRFVRGIIHDGFGEKCSKSLRILYGGSVTPENSGSLLNQANVDGALVGTASLIIDSFFGIINSVN